MTAFVHLFENDFRIKTVNPYCIVNLLSQVYESDDILQMKPPEGPNFCKAGKINYAVGYVNVQLLAT